MNISFAQGKGKVSENKCQVIDKIKSFTPSILGKFFDACQLWKEDTKVQDNEAYDSFRHDLLP